MRKSCSIVLVAGLCVGACATKTIQPIQQCQPNSGAPMAKIVGLPDATSAEDKVPGEIIYEENIDLVRSKGFSKEQLKAQFEVAFKDAVPLDYPRPKYPSNATLIGKQAVCEAHFTITALGAVDELAVYCSSPEFIPYARRAMEPIQFTPATLFDMPINRPKVVQPMSFCLNN